MNQGGFTSYGRELGWGWPSPRPDFALNPSPTCLICYGGEFCVDGLHMIFPVHVAFSMSTVLPFSPLVPTWVG